MNNGNIVDHIKEEDLREYGWAQIELSNGICRNCLHQYNSDDVVMECIICGYDMSVVWRPKNSEVLNKVVALDGTVGEREEEVCDNGIIETCTKCGCCRAKYYSVGFYPKFKCDCYAFHDLLNLESPKNEKTKKGTSTVVTRKRAREEEVIEIKDDDDEDDVELVQYVPGTEPFSMTVDLDKEEAIDVDYEKLASMKWLSEMQVVEKPKKKRRTKLVKPKAKWRVLGVIGELEKKKKQN